MARRALLVAFTLVGLALFSAGCGSPERSTTESTALPATTGPAGQLVATTTATTTQQNSTQSSATVPPTTSDTPESLIGLLKQQGLPIGEVVKFSAATDPNYLLGRPGQYVSKANFRDTRLEPEAGFDQYDPRNGGSIEVFTTDADAQVRLQRFAATRAFMPEYDYVEGKTLLRVSYRLTPDQAAQYEAAFKQAVGGAIKETASSASPLVILTATPGGQTSEATIPRTPTVDLASQVKVEMGDSNSYSDSIGTLIVVGEVVNNGPVPATNVEVAVSLIGADGKVLAAESTYAWSLRSRIPVGEKAPFKVMISDAPQSWDSIKFQVQAEPWKEGLWTTSGYYDLQVKNETLTPPANEYSGYTIAGEVANTGQAAAESVRVWAAGYGPDGKIMDVVDGRTKLDQIAPGATAPFSLEFRERREIVKYALHVEGDKKS